MVIIYLVYKITETKVKHEIIMLVFVAEEEGGSIPTPMSTTGPPNS